MIQGHEAEHSVGSFVRSFLPFIMDSQHDLWVPSLTWQWPYISLAPPTPSFPAPTVRRCRNIYRVCPHIFSRNQRNPNSRYKQSGRIDLAGIHEKTPISILSLHFSCTTPLWSESLMATTSLDSVKPSVCFIAVMFRGCMESYYPNLSFFNLLPSQKVNRFLGF